MLDYLGDARRFDMGERDHFISMEMASMGMELVAEWGSAAIVRAARHADRRGWPTGSRAAGVVLPPTHLRAPHILSVGFPKRHARQADRATGRARAFSLRRRIGRMRISPHVYNDEADIDRFLQAFRRLLA